MNHFFGHLCYVMSDVSDAYLESSELGFEVSGFAMIGIIAGILSYEVIIRITSQQSGSNTCSVEVTKYEKEKYEARLAKMNQYGSWIIGIGLFFYSVGITGVYSYLPSAASVFSASSQVFLSGLCMKWWALHRLGRHIQASRWACSILLYPLFTVIVGGFLGFGVTGVLVVGCFISPTIRFRWGIVLLAPFVVYVGLSFWVTYAAARSAVREQVWGGERISSRVEVLYDGIVNQWSWIDLNNTDQLDSIGRLNQNLLIGESVIYLNGGGTGFAYGATIEDGIIALIPRIFWPDKPGYGGSGGLVTRFTGRKFAEGTSVGIGQVMELYVNFGIWGVLIGFWILGGFVTMFDTAAANALQKFHGVTFLYTFSIGQTLLNVIGCFSETFPALVGACIFVWLTNKLSRIFARAV